MHPSATPPVIDQRFIYRPERQECPACGTTFVPGIGMWPHQVEPDGARAVCGGTDCPARVTAPGPDSCDTVVRLATLAPATTAALRELPDSVPVAERFRTISLRDDIADVDRRVLQLAAIDLEYCQASRTRIEGWEPRITLRTCGEAAGEMLLSGCAEIPDPD